MNSVRLLLLPVGLLGVLGTACAPATFTEVQNEILTPSCAAEGCHSSFIPERGLDLSEGNSFDAMVNVTAQEAGYTLVVPGEPDQSLMYLVLENEIFGDGEEQPATLGKMPPRIPGSAGLSSSQRSVIRSWIADGAVDN